MAPPTPDDIYEFLTIKINPKQINHTAFEWEALVDGARRYYRSTTPAISDRLSELVKDGRLVAIRISESGYVHLDALNTMSGPYFTYDQQHGYGSRRQGKITLDRPRDHPNPWANGTRALYMTKPRYEEMIAYFTEEQARRNEKAKAASEEKREKLRAALTVIAPDAVDVLKRLKGAVPGISVDPRQGRDGSVWLTLHASETDTTAALLDILRRGLEGGTP